MNRRAELSVVAAILLLLGIIVAASAQENSGSISGVVYRDVNANGICTNENEVGEAGIPIQLVNRDDNSTVNLTSGSGGSYELSGAAEGNWQVTVNPGSAWRVTSQQTRQVVITADEPDVEEVDFCIVQVSASTATATAVPTVTPGPTPIPAPTPVQPVLPESGAPLSAPLMLAFGLGLLFLITGAALFVHARNR
jgi:hypothetical protein